MYESAIFVCALMAGAVAAVSGFGIGSVLTPLLALHAGTSQGGIRSAAMLGFDLPKERFVATATAIALLVDAARMPVYVVVERGSVASIWPLVLIATWV